MKVAAPPQIYILQRSCHHNPEPINLNPTTTQKTRSRTSLSLKTICSLIDQVFDEIRKGKAAFLDIFIVVLHRLRDVFTDLGCERVIFLRSDHEGVHTLRIDRHV